MSQSSYSRELQSSNLELILSWFIKQVPINYCFYSLDSPSRDNFSSRDLNDHMTSPVITTINSRDRSTIEIGMDALELRSQAKLLIWATSSFRIILNIEYSTFLDMTSRWKNSSYYLIFNLKWTFDTLILIW